MQGRTSDMHTTYRGIRMMSDKAEELKSLGDDELNGVVMRASESNGQSELGFM